MGAILQVGAQASRPWSSPADFVRAAIRPAASVFRFLLLWQDRLVERDRLADMDQRMLNDMGLTRGDVARVVHRPFWQI